jgi:GAF domain-containing protein
MPELSALGVGTALGELAGLLLSTDTVEDLLQGVVTLSTRSIEPVVTAGLTVRRDARVFSAATADELAGRLDERQYERRTGPCLDALAAGEVVEAEDLAADQRWDGYPAAAIDLGIHSILSTPLMVDGEPAGVLNLYASRPRAFSEADRRFAGLLAGQAAIAIAMALRHHDQVTLSDNLRIALASRATIDQAIGIVIAQRRCSAEDAFATLRTASQRRNVKLRVVAGELVEATQRPPDDRPDADSGAVARSQRSA